MPCSYYENCNANCWADEICHRCHGKGLIIQFAMDVFEDEMVPSHVKIQCPECCGQGHIRIFCRYYR